MIILEYLVYLLSRLFCLRPTVGDTVKGHMDFSVKFIGVITEDNSRSKDFPCYVVKGYTLLSKMSGDKIEWKEEEFTIEAGRCAFASPKIEKLFIQKNPLAFSL